jgi:hypothetical protein
MSINDLFSGLKSLEDLGRENYSFSSRAKYGFLRFRSTVDNSFLVVEEIRRYDSSKFRYNVLCRCNDYVVRGDLL